MNLKHRLPLIAVIFTSVLCIAISIFSLKSGQFIVFQNLFYIPIVIACFYYAKKGLAISVALSCSYFFLIIAFTNDPMIIRDAVIRVIIFIFVAAVISALAIAHTRAEKALQESEEKYRTLIETTRDLIYTADRKGFLTYINPTLERTLGYARHEWNGKTFAQIVAPECVDSVKNLFKTAMKGESIPVYETDLIQKDGKRLSVEFNVSTIYDNEGKPSGRYGIGRDVTDRKQAELRDRLAYEVLELLNRSDGSKDTVRDILQLIKKNTDFEAVGIRLREGDDFPYYDTNGFSDDFIHAERYLCARDDERKILRDEQGNPILDGMCGNILCGRTNPALPFFTRGGSFWSNCTTELLASTTEEDRQARTRNRCNGEGYESVALIPLRSGDETIGLLQLNDRRRNQFTPEMIRFFEGLGASIGIALSRKQAEEALRESEELLNATGKMAKVGGWELDAETLEVRWTEETYRIHEHPLGRKPPLEEAINYFHPEEREKLSDSIQRALKYGEAYDMELRFITAKGNHLWTRTICIPQVVDGKTLRLKGILHDITVRKQAEEEKRSLLERLNRAEKMEALGTLAGGVAHDLNNVLGIVVGYSEMLLDGVDKSSPLRHGLENIMTGGLRAAAIVDDLLTLARRGVTGRSILNLNKIIADCQKSPEFANLSSHHPSVKIKTDIEPDLLNISGSSVHLGKSLYNLISNASEAMAKGGTVTIRTTNQYLDKPLQGYDQIREGDYVVLSVSDTGDGISTSDLKRIFEPFYTKKVMGRSGTGLGLAVVWGTVKDHHGYINVESEEGRGSTFTLYFPVTREDITSEHIAVPVSEYMGKGESILVVDDVKEQRDLAAGMLSKLNYNVSSVSSGEEAIAYLQDHQADLIILDMIMDPGMDGLDTYKQVLQIHPKQRAIIVSGFSESDRVLAARDLGAGAYVRKPYIKENLGLAVKKELDRSTLTREN
jgi:PAS domain S-box-containing protein